MNETLTERIKAWLGRAPKTSEPRKDRTDRPRLDPRFFAVVEAGKATSLKIRKRR